MYGHKSAENEKFAEMLDAVLDLNLLVLSE